jgi:hypothetical protein
MYGARVTKKCLLVIYVHCTRNLITSVPQFTHPYAGKTACKNVPNSSKEGKSEKKVPYFTATK